MMSDAVPPSLKGRGSTSGPANRFEAVRTEVDFEQVEDDEALAALARRVVTEFLPDASGSIITSNDSPDVPFRFSLNPYRGCEHGCAYCYARPTHEYLGMNAGIDFESKILVKHDAPAVLRKELSKPTWTGQTITLSGVTDCYQPVERRLRLTRGCLEVMLEARQTVGIVTKNALVVRDLDLLTELASLKLVHVFLSVSTLNARLARDLEPRAATPVARLRAIGQLREAGVPVGVMASPVIPGLNDSEMPAILEAAAKAGARSASYILLRLPLSVRPVFEAWLDDHAPDAKERVVARIRSTRGGQMNKAAFGIRMRGEGPYAEQVAATFRVFQKRFGLDERLPPLDHSLFRPPRVPGGQGRLF